MSLTVKFDRILGRLREADVETPTPPAPSHTFTATTSGSNKTYYADEKETDMLTVTVTLRYDGNPVDADTNGVPSGWEKVPNTIGQYSKTISGSGSTGNGTFSYTANGETKTASAQSKTLTKVWPAYWGTYPSGTVPEARIDTIAADLAAQHRETSNVVNRVVNVGNPKDDVWLWVVTHGEATVVDANFNLNIMEAPVSVADFASPMPDTNFDLSGYKAYVATWPAEAGQGGYGDLKMNITL